MFVFLEIVLFRMLAIFGVQTADAHCFRCVDDQYRRHGEDGKQVIVSEADAFEEFFRGRTAIQRLTTILPSKYRRRALSSL